MALKGLYSACSTPPPRIATRPTFVTVHTSTGGYCRQIQGLRRQACWIASPNLTDVSVPQAVVLAHRPPISLPRTTVSPQLLEELLGEISSLASVYHKPEETFVGRGRIGIDTVQKKGIEYVHRSYMPCHDAD